MVSATDAPAASLVVDSRCILGEGIVWDERRQALFWTDILSRELWMHAPGSGATRRFALPDMLGCLALCDDGRLLLALAKRLCLADPDAGDIHTFSVDDPWFEVVGGNLRLKANQSLNFEAAPSLPLTITATDAGGLIKSQVVTITVTNVNEAPDRPARPVHFPPGSPKDTG
jgi:hypothetical protein